jgi:hypothetical protein
MNHSLVKHQRPSETSAVCSKIEYRSGAHSTVREHRSAVFLSKMCLIRGSSQGQTLIALLIFMLLSILITTTAVTITVINTQGNNVGNFGDLARQAAETGAENAMLQLERDPTYTGETMDINNNTTATISVSGTTTRTITSVGAYAGIGTYKRTIVVTATYSGLAFTVTNWVEAP